MPPPGNTLDNRNKISAISSKEKLWTGGIIPYVIDPDLENLHVPAAIRHWEQNTPIRFVERTDQPNWVRFIPGRGCLSHVGMVGGEQRVVLSKYCGPGAGVPEIGHAVGLWHEHQRNDRDPHIWVSSCPLDPNSPSYVKDGPRAFASGPYDYGSVMHYYWIGTLETIPPGIEIGKGGPQLGTTSDTGLTAGDIDGFSRLYGRIPPRTLRARSSPRCSASVLKRCALGLYLCLTYRTFALRAPLRRSSIPAAWQSRSELRFRKQRL